MDKKIILSGAVIILLLGGYFLFSAKSGEKKVGDSNANPTVATDYKPPVEKGKTYTLAEIAKHNKPEDCWMVLEGKVYNFTEYISENTVMSFGVIT